VVPKDGMFISTTNLLEPLRLLFHASTCNVNMTSCGSTSWNRNMAIVACLQ